MDCNKCIHYYDLHIDNITGTHNCCSIDNCYLCAQNRGHCYNYKQGEVPDGKKRGEWLEED